LPCVKGRVQAYYHVAMLLPLLACCCQALPLTLKLLLLPVLIPIYIATAIIKAILHN